jgi:DNA-binding MarR family transcriptional regulator
VDRGETKHSEIASWTNTKKNNITVRIERMKKEQLVTTEQSQKDKRIYNILITDKGKELYKQATHIIEKTIQKLMLGIDESNAHEFEKFLDIIQDNLERK